MTMDGSHPYADQIGPHRPYVLDSFAGVMPALGFGATNLPSVAAFSTLTNRVLFVTVRNPRPFQPTHAYVWNGGSVSGNLSIGVYERIGFVGNPAIGALKKIVSTGSVAQAGDDTVQTIPITSPVLPAGEVILAMEFDNTVGQVGHRVAAAADLVYFNQLLGLGLFNASAFPLSDSYVGIQSPTTWPSAMPIFGVAQLLF